MVNLVAESEIREKAEFLRLYPNSKYVEIISLILMIPSSLLFVALLMLSAFVAVIYHDHCITAPILPVWLFIFSMYAIIQGVLTLSFKIFCVEIIQVNRVNNALYAMYVVIGVIGALLSISIFFPAKANSLNTTIQQNNGINDTVSCTSSILVISLVDIFITFMFSLFSLLILLFRYCYPSSCETVRRQVKQHDNIFKLYEYHEVFVIGNMAIIGIIRLLHDVMLAYKVMNKHEPRGIETQNGEEKCETKSKIIHKFKQLLHKIVK